MSIVSEASLAASPEAVVKVGELLMRVNQQLTVGNFEMDWDRGMIYFRVTNVFPEPASATPELLASLVRAAVVEMEVSESLRPRGVRTTSDSRLKLPMMGGPAGASPPHGLR